MSCLYSGDSYDGLGNAHRAQYFWCFFVEKSVTSRLHGVTCRRTVARVNEFRCPARASHQSTRYVGMALALGCLTHYMLLKFADPGALKWVGQKWTALFRLEARWALRVWRDFVGFIADASEKHVDSFFSSDVGGVTKY